MGWGVDTLLLASRPRLAGHVLLGWCAPPTFLTPIPPTCPPCCRRFGAGCCHPGRQGPRVGVIGRAAAQRLHPRGPGHPQALRGLQPLQAQHAGQHDAAHTQARAAGRGAVGCGGLGRDCCGREGRPRVCTHSRGRGPRCVGWVYACGRPQGVSGVEVVFCVLIVVQCPFWLGAERCPKHRVTIHPPAGRHGPTMLCAQNIQGSGRRTRRSDCGAHTACTPTACTATSPARLAPEKSSEDTVQAVAVHRRQ